MHAENRRSPVSSGRSRLPSLERENQASPPVHLSEADVPAWGARLRSANFVAQLLEFDSRNESRTRTARSEARQCGAVGSDKAIRITRDENTGKMTGPFQCRFPIDLPDLR